MRVWRDLYGVRLERYKKYPIGRRAATVLINWHPPAATFGGDWEY